MTGRSNGWMFSAETSRQLGGFVTGAGERAAGGEKNQRSSTVVPAPARGYIVGCASTSFFFKKECDSRLFKKINKYYYMN